MNFKLFVQPQIVPQFVTVAGSQGGEAVLNQDGLLPLPANIIYKPGDWFNYSAEPQQRTLLYQTAEAGDSDAAIFAACPGLRDWKAALVRREGEFRLNQLVTVYRESERRTWPQQRDEAIRWKTGGMQATPFCDAIAVAAGVPREEILQAVYNRIAPYDAASTLLLGQQRIQLSAIYAAGTVAELLAVTWP